MTLAQFILDNLESLLQDWTAFASSTSAGRKLDVAALRDHAEAMLRAIALDMTAEQSRQQQRLKSEGSGPRLSAADTAAELHGSARRASGFGLEQMAAEFRALRATVIRHWMQAAVPTTPDTLQELVRFNEALDQALAESLARFVKEVDDARELFLGAIAHDMRNPLSASVSAAQYLRQSAELDPAGAIAVDVLIRNQDRLRILTEDMLELMELKVFQASRFNLSQVDLAEVCRTAMQALKAAHPGLLLTMQSDGPLDGRWDIPKLERVVVNLLENALRHRLPDTPVALFLKGDALAVEMAVTNRGAPIPPERLDRLFQPMTAWSRQSGALNDGLKHYGLGLFIVREIVLGHGGTISAESAPDERTTFRVRLPRQPKNA